MGGEEVTAYLTQAQAFFTSLDWTSIVAGVVASVILSYPVLAWMCRKAKGVILVWTLVKWLWAKMDPAPVEERREITATEIKDRMRTAMEDMPYNVANPIIQDMIWKEANEPGHKTTMKTGLPEVKWRKLNEGVEPETARRIGVDPATLDKDCNLASNCVVFGGSNTFEECDNISGSDSLLPDDDEPMDRHRDENGVLRDWCLDCGQRPWKCECDDILDEDKPAYGRERQYEEAFSRLRLPEPGMIGTYQGKPYCTCSLGGTFQADDHASWCNLVEAGLASTRIADEVSTKATNDWADKVRKSMDPTYADPEQIKPQSEVLREEAERVQRLIAERVDKWELE